MGQGSGGSGNALEPLKLSLGPRAAGARGPWGAVGVGGEGGGSGGSGHALGACTGPL